MNVLALMLVKGMSNTDAMKILTRAGFSYKEIAVLVGTSYDTVKVTMHAAKKKKKV